MTRIAMSAVVALLVVFAALSDAACSSCETACEISYPTLVSGSTVSEPFSNVSCVYKYGSRGAWYKVVGGGHELQVDTCDERNNFDTVLMVFKSCRKTKDVYDDCLAMDDDTCSVRHAKITFFAEPMKTYYIFVTGFLQERGIYYLAVAEPSKPTSHTCRNAVDVKTFPYISDGDTSGSLSVRDSCLGKQSAGLWYHVEGDGQPFVAHTCSLSTDFDTIIEVYLNCTEDGEGGDPCLMYNDDSCYKQSMVAWRSVMNTDYWIFVTGSNNERGLFTLAMEMQQLNPNSRCTDPIEILTFPYVYSGTTANHLEAYSECTTKNQNGVWFRMHGLNRQVLISTCNDDNYNGDTAIDVYSHCNSESQQARQCVDHNDDYCGMNAAVIINAVEPLYYIYVYGFHAGPAGVNFTLTVHPYEDRNNTQCWQGARLTRLPMDFSGTTRGVPHCHAGCDGSAAERLGAWFRYTHWGQPTVVSGTTCNMQNILASRLEVYNDCHTMSCAAQAGYDPKMNCTTVSFAVENRKTYNVLLTADDSANPGNYYHIDFYEERPMNHSTCIDAYSIPVGRLPYRAERYTGTARPSWSSCFAANKQGYWVKVIGDGSKYVASTCDTQTDYDTVLELYDRCPMEGTAHQGCLEFSDDHFTCGLASILEWQTEKGAAYWIFVTGHLQTYGMAVLTVYHKEDPANSKCMTSHNIASLPFFDYGLTTYAVPSNASCEYGKRKGLWYTLVGEEHYVIIDTCGHETTFETEVEVYMECTETGGSVCVNHNHNTMCPPQTVIEFPAYRHVVYWVFVTGVSTDVMAEGFVRVRIFRGRAISTLSSSGLPPPHKGSAGKVIMAIIGVFWGVGLLGGAIAAGVIWYKKRNIDYVQIDGSVNSGTGGAQ